MGHSYKDKRDADSVKTKKSKGAKHGGKGYETDEDLDWRSLKGDAKEVLEQLEEG